ncbi:MAG: flippase-like domain-containing protein [Bacteroidia bacterium]|nr:flippase-like domain-containing protein [Bacteroidia bacterium]MCO5253732.1 flippase-like domain-containing protein [Bacteroidota bacterium]
MTPQSKKIIRITIFSLIGALVLFLVFRNINWKQFLQGLKQANLFWIGTAMIVGALGHWIRAARWTIMLKSIGYNSARTYPGFLTVLAGYLINLAIPRAGEISRCALMGDVCKIPVQKLIGTVVTERIIDLLMTVLIVVLVLWLQFDLLFDFTDKNILTPLSQKFKSFYEFSLFYPIVLCIVAFVFAGYYWIVRRKKNKLNSQEGKLIGFVNGIIEGAKSILKLNKPVIFTLQTFAIWLTYLGSTISILKAFEFSQSEGFFTGLSVLLFSTIGVIVPAPGGVGSIWTTQNGLMEIYGYSLEHATLFASLLFFTQVIGFIILGTFALIHLSIMKNKINATS